MRDTYSKATYLFALCACHLHFNFFTFQSRTRYGRLRGRGLLWRGLNRLLLAPHPRDAPILTLRLFQSKHFQMQTIGLWCGFELISSRRFRSSRSMSELSSSGWVVCSRADPGVPASSSSFPASSHIRKWTLGQSRWECRLRK